MKKLSTLFTIILLLPLLISQKLPRNGEKPYVEGQIMVQLKSNNNPRGRKQMLDEVLADFNSVNLAVVENLSQRMNIFLLSYNPAKTDAKRLLDEIKAEPGVELAQFNHYVEKREFIPSDPFFGLQWNLYNIGQTQGTVGADIHCPEAWDLGTSGVTATGDTIIVAIVDDGFDITHPDLKFWKNYHEIPGNGIDDDHNGYIDDYDGWNTSNTSGEIFAANHGTHVAGIAAAQGDNSIGISGVNLHVQLMPVVVSSDIQEAAVVAGYAYIVEMRSLYNETGGEKGAFVVSTNSSWGLDLAPIEDFPIWGAMYDSLGMAGILNSAATANNDWNIDSVGDVPTAFPSNFLISVTNTDKNDNKNSLAAYGLKTIDLGAPGTQIYSTLLVTVANGYGYKTGCSMSAPHVAGAVAYMYSVASENFMNDVHEDPAGMALVLKEYLLDGTDPVPSLQGKTVTGGRLNIYNSALQMLNPDITFEPLSIHNRMIPDYQDSLSLSFTNNTDSPLSYSFSFPDTLTWLSLTGQVTGSLTDAGTGTVMIHFNTTGVPNDTLFAFLSFNYSNGKHFQVPVHLFVMAPSSDLALNITADHQTVCTGNSAQLTSHAQGGTGDYSYIWTSNPAGFSSTDANVIVTPDISTSYSLQINDGIHTVTDSIRINVAHLLAKPAITSGPVTVDNYTPTSSSYSCNEATSALTYQWSVTPDEAGNTYSTGSTGKFFWAAGFTGPVLITVVAVNECGNSEVSDAFYTTIYSSEGISENKREKQLAIYPNPAGQVLRFKVSGLSEAKDYSIYIFDATGKQMQVINIIDPQKEKLLNVEQYQPGIYYVELKERNQTVSTTKFIINH